MNFPNLPSFYEDPYFSKGQNDLYGLGTDFLKGNIPDYYKPIGESGSPQFEDMLRLNTEDIQRTGYESAARMGTRGGATQSNIMKNVRSMAVPLRWADFTRSLEGRKGFLDTGVNALTGVRNAGLSFGGQKNSFNQLNYQNEIGQIKMEQDKKAAQDKMWSDIISGALGAAGTIGGAMIGGPWGAAAGGTLGSAAGKSISGRNTVSGAMGPQDMGAYDPNSLDFMNFGGGY